MPLRVTAYNAAGQVLSNVPLTFRATADAIAAVSSGGVVAANGIGTATITVSTTAGSATASTRIHVAPVVVELPFPPGAQHVEIYGVNDSRTVVGASYLYNGYVPRAFAYTPQRGSVNLTVLNPNEPVPSQARGVNGNGLITGYATRSGGFKRVVTWTPDGAIQDLGIAGFSQTYGIAINNSGQIAAYGDARDTQQYKEHAYFYDPATRVYTDLGALAGKEGVSQPAAVNDAGAVVGGSPRPSDGFLVGFMWTRAAGMREIAPPQGIGGAIGVTSDGKVAGWYNANPASFPVARGFFVRPNASTIDIGTLGGNQAQPFGMNDRGEIVGSSLTQAGTRHAFVWSETGGMTDLGNEFALPSRASAASASVVAGTVNVTSDPPPFNQNGVNERPVLWIIRRQP
jgi:probable HAF family extracellular repeat protein